MNCQLMTHTTPWDRETHTNTEPHSDAYWTCTERHRERHRETRSEKHTHYSKRGTLRRTLRHTHTHYSKRGTSK